MVVLADVAADGDGYSHTGVDPAALPHLAA
jgi:hypothetical protein